MLLRVLLLVLLHLLILLYQVLTSASAPGLVGNGNPDGVMGAVW